MHTWHRENSSACARKHDTQVWLAVFPSLLLSCIWPKSVCVCVCVSVCVWHRAVYQKVCVRHETSKGSIKKCGWHKKIYRKEHQKRRKKHHIPEQQPCLTTYSIPCKTESSLVWGWGSGCRYP